MDVQMIAEGLWRWTARHPDWEPGEDWDPEVGCVYYESPDAVVVIDPLVPADAVDEFWQALDRDVERLGRPVAVLVTIHWHERSAAVVEARYGATRERPAGVEAVRVLPSEVVYWIPEHGALVPGDALIGTPEGVRLKPPSWLAPDEDYGRFAEAAAALAQLPVERLLLSHGEPVLDGARPALEAALANARAGA